MKIIRYSFYTILAVWALGALLVIFRFFYQPADASGLHLDRNEVRRLRTPDDASDISYYYSSSPLGAMYHATYKTSELSVRSFYKEWTWKEISEPIQFRRNYTQPLFMHDLQDSTGADVTINNGIVYERIFNNGGGIFAQYDRDTGYFHIERVSH